VSCPPISYAIARGYSQAAFQMGRNTNTPQPDRFPKKLSDHEVVSYFRLGTLCEPSIEHITRQVCVRQTQEDEDTG
jgi:hypothetical protein